MQILVQFTNREDQFFQAHESFDLDNPNQDIAKADIFYAQAAFVRPGDYRVLVALRSSGTKEYSVHEQKFHVAGVKRDPLPNSWNSMPPVEFVAKTWEPDSWYLPALSVRLNLPVVTRDPRELELIVNLTPSAWSLGSYRAQYRSMGVLLPELKSVIQMKGRELVMNVSLLDLSRRKVIFRQEDVHDLDWPRMREALDTVSPGSVEVKALQDRQYSASFFVSEVEHRIATATDRPVIVIVLTMVASFEPGQDLHPIAPLPPGKTCQVFYIRNQEAARLAVSSFDEVFWPAKDRPVIDQLEPTLKPLDPVIMEIRTTGDFRRALARIMREIENP